MTPTLARAGGAFTAAMDAELVRRVEELWTEFGGNRMSFCNIGNNWSSDQNVPSWVSGSSEFQMEAGGTNPFEYGIPWEIAVGFDTVEANLVLGFFQSASLGTAGIRMTTSTLVQAVATQSGEYATPAQNSTLGDQGGMQARGYPPFWLSTGPGKAVQYYDLYVVTCTVNLSSFASDRRMLITFDLDANRTCYLISGFIRDLPPVKE